MYKMKTEGTLKILKFFSKIKASSTTQNPEKLLYKKHYTSI